MRGNELYIAFRVLYAFWCFGAFHCLYARPFIQYILSSIICSTLIIVRNMNLEIHYINTTSNASNTSKWYMGQVCYGTSFLWVKMSQNPIDNRIILLALQTKRTVSWNLLWIGLQTNPKILFTLGLACQNYSLLTAWLSAAKSSWLFYIHSNMTKVLLTWNHGVKVRALALQFSDLGLVPGWAFYFSSFCFFFTLLSGMWEIVSVASNHIKKCIMKKLLDLYTCMYFKSKCFSHKHCGGVVSALAFQSSKPISIPCGNFFSFSILVSLLFCSLYL